MSSFLFLVAWLVANVLGWFVGLFFGLDVAVNWDFGITISSRILDSAVRNGIGGVVTGLLLGLAQWLVLRNRMRLKVWWLAVTAIGVALGFAGSELLGFKVLVGHDLDMCIPIPPPYFGPVFIVVSFELGGIFVGVVTGAILGLAQWGVLRSQDNARVFEWIVASIVGLAAAFAAGHSLSCSTDELAVVGAAMGLLYGLTTGIVLLREAAMEKPHIESGLSVHN